MRQSSMIYVGLALSLLGVAVLAVTLWIGDFGLRAHLAGLGVGSSLVWLGSRVTERGGFI